MNESLLIIEPGRAEKNYWTDLWRYRELFLILVWRDIAVRYKQKYRDFRYVFRSWCSSACMCRRSASAARWFQRAGVCGTA